MILRGRPGCRLVLSAVFAGLVVAGLVVAGLVVAPARAGDPHALWRIVHDRCMHDQQQHRMPAPCALVDEAGGFAVLKDIVGAEQFLLIPTVRLAGIESPELLRGDAPNYFADAWAQVPLLEARLHRKLPREDIALAINSAYGRSQDQLHIHIDCIGAPVHAALMAQLDAIGSGWSELRTPLAGHRYRAMRIAGERLEANPFHRLAQSLPGPAQQMGRHTLVLVGARFPEPGFILLDGRLDLLRLDRAAGETLQDHSCAIAEPPGTP